MNNTIKHMISSTISGYIAKEIHKNRLKHYIRLNCNIELIIKLVDNSIVYSKDDRSKAKFKNKDINKLSVSNNLKCIDRLITHKDYDGYILKNVFLLRFDKVSACIDDIDILCSKYYRFPEVLYVIPNMMLYNK